jgi:prepilin-type N-terminal cleavage/methylation domain-containing protein
VSRKRRIPTSRRGFSLLELMVALAISALLLTAALVALDASFRAYRRTTEEVATHTTARLAMHRLLALVRTGKAFDFDPPLDPFDDEIEATSVSVFLPPDADAFCCGGRPKGRWITVRWIGEGGADGGAGSEPPCESCLVLEVRNDVCRQVCADRDECGSPCTEREVDRHVLLGGVEPQFHADGTPIMPFRIAYEDGWRVRRVTVDLSIQPDDDISTSIAHEPPPPIRLVGSASPRSIAP